MKTIILLLAMLLMLSCTQNTSSTHESLLTIVSPNFQDTAYFAVNDFKAALINKGPNICFWRMVHITPGKVTYDDWIFAPSLQARIDTSSVDGDYIALLEKIQIKNPYYVK